MHRASQCYWLFGGFFFVVWLFSFFMNFCLNSSFATFYVRCSIVNVEGKNISWLLYDIDFPMSMADLAKITGNLGDRHLLLFHHHFKCTIKLLFLLFLISFVLCYFFSHACHGPQNLIHFHVILSYYMQIESQLFCHLVSSQILWLLTSSLTHILKFQIDFSTFHCYESIQYN